jgi:hypothetical protein
MVIIRNIMDRKWPAKKRVMTIAGFDHDKLARPGIQGY